MIYPATRTVDTVDEYFGRKIADPYRWLESDIRRNPEVAAWVAAQNGVSAAYLLGRPARSVFRKRLIALFDHERLTTPEKRGRRYFFTRNSGLDNQAILFVREGVSGADAVVVDPNEWSDDGTTALVEWAPSEDGGRIAFAIQEGGSDWRTIFVLDVESGARLDDEIKWARFTNIAWMKNGSGFFYSRNPEPEESAVFVAPVHGHSVYFHRIGTPQSEDKLVYAPEAAYPLIHTADVTVDGRFVVIYSAALMGGNALATVDLTDSAWPVRIVIDTFDRRWHLAGNTATTLFLSTDDDAERGKIVTVDISGSEPVFTDLIPEREGAVLRFGSFVGSLLIATYMVDAKTEVRRYQLDGTLDGVVDLPGIGSAGPFHGRPGDNEAFFAFASHGAPTSIYRFEVDTNASTVWAKPKVAIDLDQILVQQRFFSSKDGARVPIFVVRRKDVTGPAPTMLYGYGGFAISMVPYYSPAAMAWVEQGGVYAVANIRGGGEYGKAWHDAGRLHNKQNVFDDFIAAGEFLKDQGITSPDGLAIHGESNGGLLIGAVVNQRPDLFAAALPSVGVLDMLRFERFTGGQMWTQEFGTPSVEAEFRTLVAYSPLHNIRSGAIYPAIVATTGDRDDRVVPAHSFKYVATLQAADIGTRPRLLRVETQAGHGAGKPIDKVIEEVADMWAFAAYWTGLEVDQSD